ncbi:MAG: DUF2065 domain-containing protein [Alphaproteobacteria bacterium]|nr:DUF2065 domain-containing protein [Alphaproteobacteria bacterium]
MAFELLTFLGLALLVEGVILALFPAAMRRMMEQFAALPPDRLRMVGLGFAVAAAVALVILSHVADDGGGRGMAFAFPETRRLVGTLF